MNRKVIEALVLYVETLSRCADATHRAEDRPKYQQHLATAARMFVACHRDDTLTDLRALIADERRSYGWAYLSDAPGETAERAFDTFAKLVESREPEAGSREPSER